MAREILQEAPHYERKSIDKKGRGTVGSIAVVINVEELVNCIIDKTTTTIILEVNIFRVGNSYGFSGRYLEPCYKFNA